MPRKTKADNRSNTKFVRDLMEFPQSGALMQPFVLKALEYYSAACIQAGPATFDSGFLNGRAWVACAEECKRKIAERYGQL